MPTLIQNIELYFLIYIKFYIWVQPTSFPSLHFSSLSITNYLRGFCSLLKIRRLMSYYKNTSIVYHLRNILRLRHKQMG